MSETKNAKLSLGSCLLVAGGVAAAVLAVLVLLVFHWFTGPEHRQVEWSVPSPDGRRVAHVLAVSAGNATVGVSWLIVVAEAGREPRLDQANRNWIWKSYDIPPDRLHWRDATTIVVPVDMSYEVHKSSVKTRVRGGVSALTVWTREPEPKSK